MGSKGRPSLERRQLERGKEPVTKSKEELKARGSSQPTGQQLHPLRGAEDTESTEQPHLFSQACSYNHKVSSALMP